MKSFWEGFEKRAFWPAARHLYTEPGVAPITHAGTGASIGAFKGKKQALIGAGLGALSGLTTGQIRKALRRKK